MPNHLTPDEVAKIYNDLTASALKVLGGQIDLAFSLGKEAERAKQREITSTSK